MCFGFVGTDAICCELLCASGFLQTGYTCAITTLDGLPVGDILNSHPPDYIEMVNCGSDFHSLDSSPHGFPL